MVARAALVALVFLAIGAASARADHTPVPGTVALVGSLQSELGCPGDWQPECPQTRLQPVAGRPACSGRRSTCPAGAYEYKVALNNSWDENYGAGGAPGGGNIALTAPGGPVTFTYDHATHVISDDLPRPVGSERGAHWLRRGRDRVGPAGRARGAQLPAALARRDGGLTARGRRDRGRLVVPLTLDPAGLPAGARAQFPHLAAYEALRLPRAARRRARELLTGQLVVAAYDADGRLVRRDRRADPRRARPTSTPTPRRARPRPGLARPPARAGRVGADGQAGRPADLAQRPRATRVAMRRGDDGVWRVKGRPLLARRGLRVRGRGLRPDARRGRDERRHRPVLAGADDELDALGAGRPRRPAR